MCHCHCHSCQHAEYSTCEEGDDRDVGAKDGSRTRCTQPFRQRLRSGRRWHKSSRVGGVRETVKNQSQPAAPLQVAMIEASEERPNSKCRMCPRNEETKSTEHHVWRVTISQVFCRRRRERHMSHADLCSVQELWQPCIFDVAKICSRDKRVFVGEFGP